MSESYQAAAFLLRASCLGHLCDDTILNDTNERIEWDELERFALSRGEQVVLDAAADLYNGTGDLHLYDAICHLDAQNWAALVRAMELRRPCNSNLLVEWHPYEPAGVTLHGRPFPGLS